MTKYKSLNDCGKPTIFDLKSFDMKFHIGHIVNQRIQDYNDIQYDNYIKNLEQIIQCYEAQILKQEK